MNKNPEQIARDKIDEMLRQAGWMVQSKEEVDLSAGKGIAIREYQTDVGPADYEPAEVLLARIRNSRK